MTAAPRAQQIATQLAALASDQPHLGEFMLQLAAACAKDISEAAPLYQSFEMWGGPGSFADQAGSDLDAGAKSRMNDLMIELFDEFQRHDIHYDRAAGWVSAFRKWQEMDIFRKANS